MEVVSYGEWVRFRFAAPGAPLALAVAACGVVALGSAAAMVPDGSSEPAAEFVVAESPAGLGLSPHISAERLTPAEVTGILVDVGWPRLILPEALAVITCESQFRPIVVGSYGEFGLFQIHPVHIPRFREKYGNRADPFDPVQNATIALDIWREFGWDAWTCRP